VEHVYGPHDEKTLINILDSLPEKHGSTQMQKRRFFQQMADASTELLGRNIDESDFKISYPDVQIRPMAIYLFT
jgi:hypothetical protein